MEPQISSFLAKHTQDSNPATKWFLHHRQSQKSERIEGFCAGVDKFWEDQWSFHTKDFTIFNRQGQVIDQNFVQCCDSPLASDSSSSLSTHGSSAFSWNSDSSYTAGRQVLQSPELLSSRFSGFSLFNSGINILEGVSKEGVSSEEFIVRKQQQEQFLSQNGDLLLHVMNESIPSIHNIGSIGCLRDIDDTHLDTSETIKEGVPALTYGQTCTTKDYVDDDWVSDSSDSQSCVSTSSQELLWKDTHNGTHLGRPCTDHACLLSISSTQAHNSADHWHADVVLSRQGHPMPSTTKLRNSCTNLLGTDHKHDNAVEKLCVATPHQPCRLSFASETYGSILDEGVMSDQCLKQHSIEVLCDLSEHTEGEHKPDEVSQCESVMVDSKPKLPLTGSFKHLPITSPNTVISTSLQSGNVEVPLLHTKLRYSAAVKERFASSTLHGYLRYAEQGGSPCYSFFVDDSDEVLFARACGQEKRSNKENCDWTYTFHSKKDNGKAKATWKGWSKRENLASDLVANMKVAGVSHSNVKGKLDGCAKEARFVLFDGRGQQHVESQAIGDAKIGVHQLKPVVDNKAASETEYAKQRVEPYITNHAANTGHVNIRPGQSKSVHSLNMSAKNGSIHTENVKTAAGSTKCGARKLSSCHINQTELAAIVISTSVKEKKMTRRKEGNSSHKGTAGWGVKFLDKGSESGWGLSFMEKSKSSNNARGLEEMACCRVLDGGEQSECIGAQTTGGACQNNMVKLENGKGTHTKTHLDLAQKPEMKMSNRKNKLKIDVTVILPAGDHGLPMEGEDNVGYGVVSHGPTPLLERWMSGGECECGGWDMGCGLSIFKAETLTLRKRTSNLALTRNDRMNWLSPGKPFKLFTQDYKKKVVLMLEIIEAGLFSLSFQARFSPLQAFHIAVALFHQQMSQK